jgi:hypothetical protein
VDADEEEWPEMGIAHESGTLVWGMWVCDCAVCRDICRRSPEVLLVIKGSAERRIVTAGMVADAGPEELIEEGYVREVFVAEDQPRRRRKRRRPAE